MPNSKRSKRVAFFLLTLPMILVGVLFWLANREMLREKTNAALIAAIQRCNTPAALAALNASADPNARESKQAASFSSFLRNAWNRMLGHTPASAKGDTALSIATALQFVPGSIDEAVFPDVSITRALLEKGADCNVTDHDGITPLFWASAFGHETVVRLLLEHGANVNAIMRQKGYPMTALFVAAWWGRFSVVRLLLSKGADIRCVDNERTTVLMALSYLKAPDLLRRALAAGVDVNATDSQGETALMYAVRTRQTENVKILLDVGAKVNIKDKIGKTAMWYASKIRSGKIVALLKEAARREAAGKNDE